MNAIILKGAALRQPPLPQSAPPPPSQNNCPPLLYYIHVSGRLTFGCINWGPTLYSFHQTCRDCTRFLVVMWLGMTVYDVTEFLYSWTRLVLTHFCWCKISGDFDLKDKCVAGLIDVRQILGIRLVIDNETYHVLHMTHCCDMYSNTSSFIIGMLCFHSILLFLSRCYFFSLLFT
jgi:hypothetical protein